MIHFIQRHARVCLFKNKNIGNTFGNALEGRGSMKKFSEAEMKKIAAGVKKTTEKYGLPTKKKESKNDKNEMVK